VRVERVGGVTRQSGAGWNAIVWSDLDEATADAAIAAQVTHFRALVAARAGIAAERGYRYLQVDASADSRPILSRLGFAVLGTTTPYVLSPQTVQTVRG
jgi:hypothetical protein